MTSTTDTLPPLDLDAIEATALAAGGDAERWSIRGTHDLDSGTVIDQDGEVVVYDEGCPGPDRALHIATMDPATTLALVKRIRALESADPDSREMRTIWAIIHAVGRRVRVTSADFEAFHRGGAVLVKEPMPHKNAIDFIAQTQGMPTLPSNVDMAPYGMDELRQIMGLTDHNGMVRVNPLRLQATLEKVEENATDRALEAVQKLASGGAGGMDLAREIGRMRRRNSPGSAEGGGQ